jgi:hypothetical protein
MIRTILPLKRTIILHKKHLITSNSDSKHHQTGHGLRHHHLSHQMKRLKVGGAFLSPDNFVVTGRGTQRHQKPLSIDDFRKKPISKIF